MRTPDEVAAARRRDTRWWVLHGLAAIGVVALVLLAVTGVGLFVVSRPGDADVAVDPSGPPGSTSAPAPTPSATASSPSDLETDDVWAPDLDVVTEQVLTQGVELRDVRVRGTGARALDDGRMQFQELRVDALVPFSAVEGQVGRGLRLAPSSDGLVRATIPFSVLGRSFDVAADARVTPEGDRIAIEPVRVVEAGFLGDALEQIPAIRQPIPNLPEGVQVTGITVEDAGFRVAAEGRDVTVRR